MYSEGNIRQILGQRIQEVVESAFQETISDPIQVVSTSSHPELADYMSNIAFRLAKSQQRPASEIGEQITQKVDVCDICEPPSIAPPGFINFKLSDRFVHARLAHLLSDNEHLGIER